MDSMTISAIPPAEPIWCLERRDSGHLFWRRESSKVKFRYDVEVLEFTKDPGEDQLLITDSEHREKSDQHRHQMSQMIVVCATCVAAIAVTVVLPWFLIGST